MRLPPCHRTRHRALLALAVPLLPEGVPIIRGSASAPPRSGASACLTIGAAGIDRPATRLCWAMGAFRQIRSHERACGQLMARVGFPVACARWSCMLEAVCVREKESPSSSAELSRSQQLGGGME